MTIECRGEELLLCKERAIYWKAKKTLIISDIHIGKSAFFRKSGIQVPRGTAKSDLEKLSFLLNTYHTEKLIITGDMFHNYMNREVEEFCTWRASYPTTNIQLIKGNHDALKPLDYLKLNIDVFEKQLCSFPFRFIHDQPELHDEYYNLSGHIHPGVTVRGRARQQLKFPCFYFGASYAVLPAFSVFTGLSMIQPKAGDRVFAITPTMVVEV